MKSRLCFFNNEECLSNISQKQLVGTHELCYANDFNGNGASDQFYFLAPFDCIVRAVATYDNTFICDSLEKVETPTKTDYCWVMVTHTNDVDFNALGIKVGKVFRRGEKMSREGVKGIGSGNHNHIECGFGHYVNKNSGKPYIWDGRYITYGGKQYKNFVPCIDGEERPINDVMYLADVKTYGNIKSIYNWQMYNEDLPTPVERDTTKDQLKNDCTSLNVRSGAGTEYSKIGKLPQGIFNVYGIVETSDYKWFKLNDTSYVAFIEEGMTYYPKEDDTEKLKERIRELEALLSQKENECTILQDKIDNVRKIVNG